MQVLAKLQFSLRHHVLQFFFLFFNDHNCLCFFIHIACGQVIVHCHSVANYIIFLNMDKSEKKKNTPAFLRNTYEMLERSELTDIVCWADSANGFIIKNLDRFEKEILPQYFKHQKYTSFVRQLNMYGFHKQKEKYHNSYHYFGHESFRKGDMGQLDRKGVLANIKRKPEKKKKLQEGQIDEIKREEGKDEEDRQERESEYQRSVSLALEDEGEGENRKIKKEQSSQQIKNDSKQQMEQEEWECCDQTLEKTEVMVRQNESLRSLHLYFRQELIRFSERSIKRLMEGPQSTADEEKESVEKLIAVLKAETENVRKTLGQIGADTRDS